MTDQELIVDEIRRILVGPDPREDASIVDASIRPVRLAGRGPYLAVDGQEIIRGQRPSQRYGVGVLFPQPRTTSVNPPDEEPVQGPEEAAEVDTEEDEAVEETGVEGDESIEPTPDAEEGDEIIPHYSQAIARPCAMGLSFLADLHPDDYLVITVRGGRYEHHLLRQGDVVELKAGDGETPVQRDVQLWRRHDVDVTARAIGASLTADRGCAKVPAEFPAPLEVELRTTTRPWNDQGHLVTVTLVNCATTADNDQRCLFQAEMSCEIHRNGGAVAAFKPYPERRSLLYAEEDAAINLWYRNAPRFATGHGCAADWHAAEDGKVTRVFSQPMPVYWQPEITPDIEGHAPEMKQLAGDGWRQPLSSLLDAYEQHLNALSADSVEAQHREAAVEQLAASRRCLDRMRRGYLLLEESPVILRAFQLANEAMRLQQIAWRLEKRTVTSSDPTVVFSRPYRSPTSGPTDGKEPRWRAFQIAFIVMNIASFVDAQAGAEDRRIVDLIWFPTGGGKTEAYLGLAAFAMLYERLKTPDLKPHVQVLMRYTMRLLTAQQFQRTAGLICALECIRERHSHDLGNTAFRLGIWVGSAMTPNTRKDAVAHLQRVKEHRPVTSTLFPHDRCPWCGAEVGRQVRRGTGSILLGIQSDRQDFLHRCSDCSCPFYERCLPLDVVDEHIIEKRPALLIATVDKFALLPKKPELRVLFGIGDDGHRAAPPPVLIIQDELHLITDALGSMVGSYEPLIHALCEYEWTAPPKIACSTATVRTYRSQVRQLFCREEVALFPPPELTPGGSFFAPYRRDALRQVVKGKAYVGVLGSSFPSFQTAQSRTIAALLQASLILPVADDLSNRRDPYWTLVAFFSSLRELATTHTLARTQIRESLTSLAAWRGLDRDNRKRRRKSLRVIELTARRKGSDLPKAFAELERTCSDNDALDLCLATSMVEVGIDVPRLSLMCVVGQPKQFSTFIQATGRVGRRHPGVVVTLYVHTRARDRSVFEHFRAVHERLYASVEPTGLTPFAFPVQERAVAAVLAGAARLFSPIDGLAKSPRSAPAADLEYVEKHLPELGCPPKSLQNLCWFIRYLTAWVGKSDLQELAKLQAMLRRRLREWREWQRATWHCWTFRFDPRSDDPMMLDADPMAGEKERAVRWYVPNSMRDVDAESQLWFRKDLSPAIPPDDELFPHMEVASDETG